MYLLRKCRRDLCCCAAGFIGCSLLKSADMWLNRNSSFVSLTLRSEERRMVGEWYELLSGSHPATGMAPRKKYPVVSRRSAPVIRPDNHAENFHYLRTSLLLCVWSDARQNSWKQTTLSQTFQIKWRKFRRQRRGAPQCHRHAGDDGQFVYAVRERHSSLHKYAGQRQWDKVSERHGPRVWVTALRRCW